MWWELKAEIGEYSIHFPNKRKISNYEEMLRKIRAKNYVSTRLHLARVGKYNDVYTKKTGSDVDSFYLVETKIKSGKEMYTIS